MAFRVEISPEAFADLDRIATYIEVRGSFESAERWFTAILKAIETLAEMPQRCAVAGESSDLETEVRLLLHGKRNRRYKVYFSIHEQPRTVRVLHVRHWAIEPIESDELQDLMDETAGNVGEPEERG